MSDGHTVEQAGSWYKLLGPDGEQVGKSQRTAEEAWSLLDAVNAPPTDAETGLPVTEWRGMPNYHCPNGPCGYASLDPDEVYDHARGCRR